MGKKIISIDFDEVNDLYASYMPFLVNGGMFIPTKEQFELGELVGLDLKILDEPQRFQLDGSIVWLTPPGAQGGKPAGVGVKFDTSESAMPLRSKIETHLAGLLQSTKTTDTM